MKPALLRFFLCQLVPTDSIEARHIWGHNWGHIPDSGHRAKLVPPSEPVMLTALRCQKASRATESKRKLYDGGGLYLELHSNGRKYWRLKYRHGGKEKRLSLGIFPETSLAEAREQREQARRQLRDGIDPSAARVARKKKASSEAENTFGIIADEWLRRRQKHEHLAEVTVAKTKWFLSLAGELRNRPIAAITAEDVLPVLRGLEADGHVDTAHRVKQKVGQVLRYAIATGRAKHDVTADLRGALVPLRHEKRAALTSPKDIGRLLRAIDGHQGQPTTKAALVLSALSFVRPGEIRTAEWMEIDFDRKLWVVPGHKTKMRRDHLVPLSRQAIAALRDVQNLTGQGRYVFPSIRSRSRPMSENTVNVAIRDLGFGREEMTAHGFRAMASTALNELGWRSDVIEYQLAHVDGSVRGIYNRAKYLPERTKMMQAWANYLDKLKTTTKAK
jgi:integrase